MTLCLALGSGCGHPADEEQAAALAAKEKVGLSPVFSRHCSGCHGASGKLGPAPPLNDPLFLAIVPDEVLRKTIREGRPGTLMPAFGDKRWNAISDEQVTRLIADIRSGWGTGAAVDGDTPPYLRPDSPKPDPQAGAKVFAAVCARCHGEHGEGNDAGPLNAPAFLALISDQALRRIVITGRPALGMPNYQMSGGLRSSGQPLSSEELTDVVAYVLGWRGPGEQPSAAAQP